MQELPTAEIHPYPQNNRTHPAKQIERIAESIKAFGFNQPIVIDESNTVLVGHGRLLAAQLLGLANVPVQQVTSLTAAQKRAYRILDNKLQNDSEWDFAMLEKEIAALVAEDFNLAAWGLDELLPEEEEEEITEDDGPGDIPDEPYIKLGDLIELGPHKLLCADSSKEGLDVTADMIITDPPYGVSYVGKTKEALEIENDNLSEEDLSALWNNALDQALKLLKDGGAFYASVPPGPLGLVFEQILKQREILRQRLVWQKDSMVLGHSDYHYKHEPILYGWKPGAAHYMTEDRTKTSILEHARPKRSKEHPTMKPLPLWAELIQNSSKPGQIVYDMFLGSGTTLIACDKLKRICYGIEIDPRYCQVIIERYQQLCEAEDKSFDCFINGEKFDGTTEAHLD